MLKLSIVVPAYNVGKKIGKTLDSIFSQDAKYPFEVICVCGPSTDNTKDVIREYIKKHDNLKIVEYEKANLIGARKVGIQEAQGEYLTFCDGDDAQHKDFINFFVSKMDQTGADMVNAGFCYVINKFKWKTIFRKTRKYDRNQFYRALVSDAVMKGYLWCKTFKTSILKSIDFYVPETNIFREDMYLNLVFGTRIHNVYTYYRNVYYYDKSGDSLFSSINKKRMYDFFRIIGFQRWMIEKTCDKKTLDFYRSKDHWRKFQVIYDYLYCLKAFSKEERTQLKKEMRRWLKIFRSKDPLPKDEGPWKEYIEQYENRIDDLMNNK